MTKNDSQNFDLFLLLRRLKEVSFHKNETKTRPKSKKFWTRPWIL